MNPRWIAFFKLVALLVVATDTILLFPPAHEFVAHGRASPYLR